MIKHVPITRRYWFWQQRNMLRDDIGYIYAINPSPLDYVRPRAIKWIPVDDRPGALTAIPAGWRPWAVPVSR